MPIKQAESLLKELESFGERLRIPAMVASEFEKNLDTVLKAQLDSVRKEWKESLPSIFDPEVSGPASNALTTRTGAIPKDVTASLTFIEDKASEFHASAREVKERVLNIAQARAEKIASNLKHLVRSRSLPVPTRQKVSRLCRIADERAIMGRGPGIDDDGKPGSVELGGFRFPRKLCDQIIWQEVLGSIKEESITELILVSEDGSGQNKKKLGFYRQNQRGEPLPECVLDASFAGVNAFAVCSISELLSVLLHEGGKDVQDGEPTTDELTDIANAVNDEIERIYRSPKPSEVLASHVPRLERCFRIAAEPFQRAIFSSSVHFFDGFNLPESVQRLRELGEADSVRRVGGMLSVHVAGHPSSFRIVTLISARNGANGPEVLGIGELWITRGNRYHAIPDCDRAWSELESQSDDWEQDYTAWCALVLKRGLELVTGILREMPAED